MDYYADRRIHDTIGNLLGKGYQALGSDSQQYACGSAWHRDTIIPMQPKNAKPFRMLKVSMYTEDLSDGRGSLWIIPGSHHQGPYYDALNDLVSGVGVEGRKILPQDIPGAFDTRTRPGDILFFDQCAYHGSFGGLSGRRILSMTFCEKPTEDWHFEWFDFHTERCAKNQGIPKNGCVPAALAAHPSRQVKESTHMLAERFGRPDPDWTARMNRQKAI